MATEDEESIPLEGDEQESVPLDGPAGGGQASSKIQAFGSAAAQRKVTREYRRSPTVTGTGALRCRMFNSKITVAAMDHMVEQINEWLDANEVEVKHVTQVVGTLEGKTPEPNVILTVWY